MNNVLKSLVLLVLLLVLAACGSVAPVQPQEQDVEIASVATVTIGAGDTEDALAAKYGAKVIAFKPEAGFAVLGFPKGQLTALNTTTNMDFFAHPEVQAAGSRAWGSGRGAWGGGMKAWGSGKGAWGSGSTTPTPPAENTTIWNQINLYEAHKDSRNFGLGIKVAVLDTGLDTSHEIFQGSLAPSSEWKDFVDNDSNPQEGGGLVDAGFGHGTAVAGIILQVAPRVTILPIRVLDRDGGGDLDDVIAGIDWAIQKGAKIINLSLGSVSNTDALTNMINYAASRNVLIVSSAGNQGQANAITFPARMSRGSGSVDGVFGKVYSVGSVNSSSVTSLFSNYAGNLSGVAPGENIYTAFPGNQMIAATGTSFAAPLYSGAFALALSENPWMSVVNLFIQFQNRSAERSWTLNLWNNNFTARGFWDMGKGLINVEGLVEGARYGWGNLVGNPYMTEGLTYWSATSTSMGYESGRNEVAVINGRGGFEQTLTGLHPNTTYRYQVEYKLSSPADSIWIEYFVNGTWVERSFQGTAWTKANLTFTTGANQTTATISIWKSSTTGTATVDNFFVAKQ